MASGVRILLKGKSRDWVSCWEAQGLGGGAFSFLLLAKAVRFLRRTLASWQPKGQGEEPLQKHSNKPHAICLLLLSLPLCPPLRTSAAAS